MLLRVGFLEQALLLCPKASQSGVSAAYWLLTLLEILERKPVLVTHEDYFSNLDRHSVKTR